MDPAGFLGRHRFDVDAEAYYRLAVLCRLMDRPSTTDRALDLAWQMANR